MLTRLTAHSTGRRAISEQFFVSFLKVEFYEGEESHKMLNQIQWEIKSMNLDKLFNYVKCQMIHSMYIQIYFKEKIAFQDTGRF